MLAQLEQLAEALARRFAMFLRAPLANQAPNTTGGPPRLIKKNSGPHGVPLGQVNGLQLQGQLWTVTISAPYNVEKDLSGNPFLINVRPWIYCRIHWAIGMVKHTADLDLPANSLSITLPFDSLEVFIVNDSPTGTLPILEFEPNYTLGVASAFAGRTTALGRRTIFATAVPVAGVFFAPPAFSSTVEFAFASAPPFQTLNIEFLAVGLAVLGATTLTTAAQPDRPLPMDVPHGTAQIRVTPALNTPQDFAAIFTLSI